MSAMLEVKDLVVSYGKIKAVKGISFDVNEGEVVTLIGTNGAGKTTTLRTISGLLRPAAGSPLPVDPGQRADGPPRQQRTLHPVCSERASGPRGRLRAVHRAVHTAGRGAVRRVAPGCINA